MTTITPRIPDTIPDLTVHLDNHFIQNEYLQSIRDFRLGDGPIVQIFPVEDAVRYTDFQCVELLSVADDRLAVRGIWLRPKGLHYDPENNHPRGLESVLVIAGEHVMGTTLAIIVDLAEADHYRA